MKSFDLRRRPVDPRQDRGGRPRVRDRGGTVAGIFAHVTDIGPRHRTAGRSRRQLRPSVSGDPARPDPITSLFSREQQFTA